MEKARFVRGVKMVARHANVRPANANIWIERLVTLRLVMRRRKVLKAGENKTKEEKEIWHGIKTSNMILGSRSLLWSLTRPGMTLK